MYNTCRHSLYLPTYTYGPRYGTYINHTYNTVELQTAQYWAANHALVAQISFSRIEAGRRERWKAEDIHV